MLPISHYYKLYDTRTTQQLTITVNIITLTSLPQSASAHRPSDIGTK